MKHFGNCDSTEFMSQLYKLRGPLIEWLKATGAADIYKKHIGALTKDATPEDVITALELVYNDTLQIGMDEHYDLTCEVLALATFTDPDKFTDHPFVDYLHSAYEMFFNRKVRDFFTLSLAPSLRTSTKP